MKVPINLVLYYFLDTKCTDNTHKKAYQVLTVEKNIPTSCYLSGYIIHRTIYELLKIIIVGKGALLQEGSLLLHQPFVVEVLFF